MGEGVMKYFGAIRIKIDERLKELGMSRDELSCKTQIPVAQINQCCAGQVTRVNLDILARLCRVLDCSIDDILEYVPPPRQKSKPKNKAPPVIHKGYREPSPKKLIRLFYLHFPWGLMYNVGKEGTTGRRLVPLIRLKR